MKFRLPLGTSPRSTTRNVRTEKKSASQDDGRDIVMRRHPEWTANQMTWRRLMDSFEGGDRFRNGIYGYDRFGMPNRMLFRHLREYPDPQKYPSFYMNGFPNPDSMLTPETSGLTAVMGPFPGQIGTTPPPPRKTIIMSSAAPERRYRNGSAKRSRFTWPKSTTRK